MKGLIKELAFVNKPPLGAHYVYYVKYDVTIRQILSALLSLSLSDFKFELTLGS